jgi:hypothetical protein
MGDTASSLFSPGTVVVVDESLYEFNGGCPVRRFIPRKPHPNGLLVYGMASYVHAGADELPVLLDLEPYALGNLVTPQEAMMRLAHRLRTRKPHLQPHLVVDSAFGSFDRLRQLRDLGTSPVFVLSSRSRSICYDVNGSNSEALALGLARLELWRR